MGEAAGTLAKLARAQWEDYIARFRPLENQLMQMTTYENPAIITEEISKGQKYLGNQYDATIQNQAIQMQSYGISPTGEQRAVNERVAALGKAAALADAANRIRQRLIDRNREIAFGTNSMKFAGQQEIVSTG